jgi:radical SAM superfamily enzyme YgiQ (UPF0313 family)
MVKLLLINSNRFKQPWPVIPYGLCCIAASAEEAGHDVRVLDLCFADDPEKEIADTVEAFKPGVIGISVRNIDNGVGHRTRFLLEDIREHVIRPCRECFGGPVLIGGPAVGISGREMLHYFDLAYAICGDGELAVVEFLRRLESGSPFGDMPGLIVRKGREIISDKEPMRVEDLDALPRVSPSRYVDLSGYSRVNSPLQIQTKRGCALHCSYCTYNRIEGFHYRLRRPSAVADEIERLVKETGINRVEFVDSTFNIPLSNAKSVLREIIRKGLDLDLLTMGLNPGAVDGELVDLMKEAGFREVDLGVDAGCDAMLKSLGKNFLKEDVLRAGKLLRDKNIAVKWFLLLGAPGESRETLCETFETVRNAASPWDLIVIGVGMRVYNGSSVAEWVRTEKPSSAKDNFLFPVSLPEGTTIDLRELKQITKIESFRRTNFFLYDDDEKTTLSGLAAGTALMKIFSLRQPLWRLFILQRKIESFIGLRRWQERRFRKHIVPRPCP